MGRKILTKGKGIPEGDDTQYLLAQDPGYLEWMEKQRKEFEEELKQDVAASHKEWLEEPGYMTDEEWRQEKRFFMEYNESCCRNYDDEENEE